MHRLSCIFLFLSCLWIPMLFKGQVGAARVRVGPFPDTLFVGIDNYLVVEKPEIKKASLLEISVKGGGAAASPAGLSVFRIRVSKKGPVEIRIKYSGKEIYKKSITPISVPPDKKFLDRMMKTMENDSIHKKISG